MGSSLILMGQLPLGRNPRSWGCAPEDTSTRKSEVLSPESRSSHSPVLPKFTFGNGEAPRSHHSGSLIFRIECEVDGDTRELLRLRRTIPGTRRDGPP